MTEGLVIENLTVRYGKAVAVNEVSLEAPAGCVTALVGPNGAGKSSFVLGTYGSIPAEGRVMLDGADLSERSALARARAGMMIVPQGRQLFPKMTVQENLEVMANLLKIPAADLNEAVDRFPILRKRANAYAGVLSGGEQQMLVLARALMAKPRAILLDEMMTGLAPRIVAGLRDTLRTLADEGVTVLVADPSLTALRKVIDRGYVMVRSSLVASGENVNEVENEYQRAMGIIVHEIEDSAHE